MRRAAAERRHAIEEQLRLHELCRTAEAEKHNAILQADAEISESLRRQVEATSSSYTITAPIRVSAATSTSRSIESLYKYAVPLIFI